MMQLAKSSPLLEETSIDHSALLVSPASPTIVKTLVIARHQQVVRIDREQRRRIPPDLCRQLLARLSAQRNGWNAVIFSDYAKGFLTEEVASGIVQLARGLIVTVDPSPFNPLPWHGVTAVKPNLREARAAAGVAPDAPPEETAARLLERWDTQMVLITMGEHGMLLVERGGEPYHTPTRAREVFDVSGAGDTAIAVFTLALAAGASPREAAELANHASGVAVGKLGTAVVSPDELLESVARMA